MGLAFAGCFLKEGLSTRDDLLFVEQLSERREQLAAQLDCRIGSEIIDHAGMRGDLCWRSNLRI